MSLRDFLRVLRKRWRLIAAAVLVCLVAAGGYTLTRDKVYQATAQIFVSTAGASDSAVDLAQGNTFTQARVQSYTSVATSPAVIEAVIRDLGLPVSAGQLADAVSADAPLDKVLINLHARDGDPQQAARIVNAVAAEFSSVVEELEKTPGASESPVKLTVTHPAKAPTAPIEPRTRLYLALGLLVGLLIGVGVAMLREVLDNTVKDPAELGDVAGLPVLGIVPWDKVAAGSPLSFRIDAHGSRAESFRQMRTNLQFVDVDHPPRTIAVTSALPGEGKTHTALNLAFAIADAGQRVCLIEADLRRPTLAKSLGIVGEVGLTSVLIGKADVDDVIQRVSDNLGVIASGQVPPNPSELLESDAFRRVLDSVRQMTDVVVIDTAPLLPVADGAQIAASVDATLLTVRANKTTREQIARAIATLANVAVTPVGVVLSMTPHTRGSSYAYYDGYRPARSHAASSSRRSAKSADASVIDGAVEAPAEAPADAPEKQNGARASIKAG